MTVSRQVNSFEFAQVDLRSTWSHFGLKWVTFLDRSDRRSTWTRCRGFQGCEKYLNLTFKKKISTTTSFETVFLKRFQRVYSGIQLHIRKKTSPMARIVATDGTLIYRARQKSCHYNLFLLLIKSLS